MDFSLFGRLQGFRELQLKIRRNKAVPHGTQNNPSVKDRISLALAAKPQIFQVAASINFVPVIIGCLGGLIVSCPSRVAQFVDL